MATDNLDRILEERLRELDRHHLRRELRWLETPPSTRIVVDGQSLLNFSSNDYLGLANDRLLKSEAIEAIQAFGVGSGASRLICGSLPVHRELEETLATFKGTEAALTFGSGYAAALGAITALMDKNDVIIIDRLSHACIVDAARLSGAKLRVFPHNDAQELHQLLQQLDRRNSIHPLTHRRRVLVVTESVFSMDGDPAPLKDLVEVKDKYGAWLMVDEAHATGLYGRDRCGLAQACGVVNRIEVQMGTLSKAIGSTGGFICGSRILIDYLVNRARSFIFSTAPSPATTAAATAAIRFIQSPAGAERCYQLWQRVRQIRNHLAKTKLSPTGVPSDQNSYSHSPGSAIIPVWIGDESEAVKVAGQLRSAGIFVPAIRYPAVAKGAARLRITASAAHPVSEVEQLLEALQKSCPTGICSG
jgi:8-amino-7-oxononanoate synthase